MQFRIHCSVLEDYFSKMSSMLSETLPLYYKHMLNFFQLSIIICYSSFIFFLLSILGYSLDRQNTIFISDVPIGESLGLSSSVNVMVKKVVKLWSYFPQGKSCFVTLLASLHLRTEKKFDSLFHTSQLLIQKCLQHIAVAFRLRCNHRMFASNK